jgi:hypothetical protein
MEQLSTLSRVRRKAALALLTIFLPTVVGGRPASSLASTEKSEQDRQFRAGKPEYTKVTGIVRDESGRPLADVDLILQALDERDKPIAIKSGADGHYSFPAFKDHPNRYFSIQLLAAKKGFVPAIGHISPLDEPRVDFALKVGGSLTGTVRDRNGQPVSNAAVLYQTLEGGPGDGPHSWMYPSLELVLKSSVEPYFVARTDARGQFRFAAVPLDKKLGFLVKAEGMRDLNTTSDRPALEYSAQPGSPAPWLILVPDGRVSGRVRSEVPELKLKGLEIWLHPVRGSDRGEVHRVWCDDNGQFVFRGLPEVSGYVELGMQSEDWVPKSAPLVTVREGEEAKVEIRIIEGVIVEGKVIASEGKLPVAGVGVVIHAASRPKATQVRHYAKTDESGVYRLRLPPGEALFYPEIAPRAYARPSEKDFKQIVIPEGVKKLAGPTFTLQRR